MRINLAVQSRAINKYLFAPNQGVESTKYVKIIGAIYTIYGSKTNNFHRIENKCLTLRRDLSTTSSTDESRNMAEAPKEAFKNF